MSISQQLRDYLAEACDERGVNEVARQAQLSSPQISRIRTGGRGFSVDTLDQIGNYLGLALVRVDKTDARNLGDEIAQKERQRAKAFMDNVHRDLNRLLGEVDEMRKRFLP